MTMIKSIINIYNPIKQYLFIYFFITYYIYIKYLFVKKISLFKKQVSIKKIMQNVNEGKIEEKGTREKKTTSNR